MSKMSEDRGTRLWNATWTKKNCEAIKKKHTKHTV